MKRFAEEKPVMLRRQRVGARVHSEDSRFLKLGRLRKKHPFDCGQPRCGVCSSHKQFGHQDTRQEKRARLKLQESQ